MATIKQIDGRSIHQIQSGQVIVDLCSVVKELVENSIDAGATAIDFRFKNQGLELIEVQDNGSGISPADYSSVALKHFTSKLSSYSDISSLHTFGFRGEALASLCALATLTVTTCLSKDVPKGTKLAFDSSGKLQDTSVTASQRGTTVSVENLFHSLPVRRRELDRNIKREWQKVIALLHQYACIQINLKFSVSHQPTKGKRILLFSTKGNLSIRENIINIFGIRTMAALVSLELKMEMKPSATRSGVLAMAGSSTEPKEVRIIGHVSRPVHGEGRQTPDRQMFFVNGRPCALPQFAKVFNEVYRSYNSSQSPFILADIRLDTDLYDVNVSPDKRSILLHDQSDLLDYLHASLINLFDAHDYSVPASYPSSMAKQPPQKNLESGRAPVLQKYGTGAKESKDSSDTELDTDDDTTERYPDEIRVGSRPISSAMRYKVHQQDESLVSMFARRQGSLARQPGLPSSDASLGSLDVGDRMAPVNANVCDEIKDPHRPVSPEMSGPSLITDSEIHNVQPHILRYSIPKRPGEGDPSPEKTPSEKKCQIIVGDRNLKDVLNSNQTSPRGKLGGRTDARSYSLSAKQALRPILGQQTNDPSILQDDTHSSDDLPLSIGISTPQIQETRAEISTDSSPNDEPQLPEECLSTIEENIKFQPSKPTFYDRNSQSSAKTIDDSDTKAKASNDSSMQALRSDSRRKDITARLSRHVSVTEQSIQSLLRGETNQSWMSAQAGFGARQVEEIAAADAELKLPLIIAKSDFAQMRVAGQFNLGFILAVRPAKKIQSAMMAGHDELFIIDQHASDEKYNFEKLQSSTTIQAQRLVHPKRLHLTALEEEILLENTTAIEANGFKIDIDTTGRLPVGSRCQLIALPLSCETAFSVEDLEELICLLGDSSSESSQIPRPSKVRKMLAMRACRSSVMIGKALTKSHMYGLVKHMGELDKPWDCPHGRPTMRHLIRLQSWDGTSWNADVESSPLHFWKGYLGSTR